MALRRYLIHVDLIGVISCLPVSGGIGSSQKDNLRLLESGGRISGREQVLPFKVVNHRIGALKLAMLTKWADHVEAWCNRVAAPRCCVDPDCVVPLRH